LAEMTKAGKYDQRVIKNAVAKVVPAINDADVLYDIDCRDWLPKGLSYIEGMHTGCHPELFNRIVTHADFPLCLTDIKANMEEDRTMSRKNMAMLVCDLNGRHSAMAVAKAFAECIVADPGFSLGTVHILANQYSEGFCGVCARCEFWTRRWMARNSAVQAVKDVWFGRAETIVPAV
jgi:hypothetical protein